jgi:hypothetical protein
MSPERFEKEESERSKSNLAPGSIDMVSYAVVYPTVWYSSSHVFTRRLRELAGESADDVLREIEGDLTRNPERGDVVKGLGGIR